MIAIFPEYWTDAQKAIAATFYDDVEWALDIRGARFKELELRGIPGNKVLRDPERHVLLRKDRIAKHPKLVLGSPGFGEVLLDTARDRPDEPEIFCANELSEKFEDNKAVIRYLREKGLAE
jgi:hypothetical protein